MYRWKILAATALAAMLFAETAAPPIWARELQPLATALPEQVGMSAERLGRITTMLQKEIARGKLPGAVVMVARKGKIVYSDAIGFQDKGEETPMKLDSIFRIYSMTKPLVSVAAMMLVEEAANWRSIAVLKRPSNTAARTVATQCGPRGDHRIRCFLAMRALAIRPIVDQRGDVVCQMAP